MPIVFNFFQVLKALGFSLDQCKFSNSFSLPSLLKRSNSGNVSDTCKQTSSILKLRMERLGSDYTGQTNFITIN